MKQNIFLLLSILSLITYSKLYSAYFGPQVIYKNYKEDLPIPQKSTEQGILYGFTGGISSNIAKIIYTDICVEYAQGNTKYIGTKQDLLTKETRLITSTTENNLLNIEGKVKFPHSHKRITIAPFGGIGYHLWDRKLEEYVENYHWLYFLFGGSISINLTSFYDIGLEVKGMRTKLAKIEINDIYPWRQDLILTNKLQYCLKFFNKFSYKSLNLYLSIFYKKLKIGPSESLKKRPLSAPFSIDKNYGSEMILEVIF